MSCVDTCGQLSRDCFKQEVGQEALREKIKEIESKMEAQKQVDCILQCLFFYLYCCNDNV